MTSTDPLTDVHGYIAGGPPMTQPTEQDLEKARRACDEPVNATGMGPSLVERVALALAAEREKGTAWRPIETAPKDGTSIIICNEGGFVGEAYFHHVFVAGYSAALRASRPAPLPDGEVEELVARLNYHSIGGAEGDVTSTCSRAAFVLSALSAERDALREALAAVVADILDYERVNNLAPNPGKQNCWQSVTRARALLRPEQDARSR